MLSYVLDDFIIFFREFDVLLCKVYMQISVECRNVGLSVVLESFLNMICGRELLIEIRVL